MFLVSNKTMRGCFYLLAAVCLLGLPSHARGEAGIITATGTGRDAGDAIANLLRSTVAKYFRDQPPSLVRAILQSEILPNASSFVQSYRIVETGKAGSVTLNASVDLDVIQGLLSFTPKNLGETGPAKVLVVVKGAKLPDNVTNGLKANAVVADPYGALEAAAKERFLRRQFGEAPFSQADLQVLGSGEEISSPEVLRSVGAKVGARVALAIVSHYELFENENSHSKEERLVLNATLVDLNTGAVLGRGQVNAASPKSRKEQYLADLQRSLLEDSRDLFQDVLVAAGRRLMKVEGKSEYSIVRVQFPSNYALVNRFRQLLETIPGMKSALEYRIRRGAYDFALRPAQDGAALAKALANVQSPDLSLALVQPLAAETEEHPPILVVKLAPRMDTVPAAEGVPNAAH